MKKILLYVLSAGLLFTWLKIHNDSTTVELTPQTAMVYQKTKKVEDPRMDNPNMYAEMMVAMRTKDGETAPSYQAGYKLKELKKAKEHALQVHATARSAASDLTFDERGPANVPGRTRGMIIDPNDASGDTWFGASAGGGIWKTTDAGVSWTNMTPELPNLASTYMAMSASDNNVIYVGTGEGFFASVGMIDGAGIFKSEDAGTTWSQLEATADETVFGHNVNRIIVSPTDANVLLAATNSSIWQNGADRTSAILKSTDGGATWNTVYSSGDRVQDLIFDPNNFDVQYGGVNSVGVIKSTDGGETWSMSNEGMNPSGRVELAMARTNSNRIFASTEGGLTGTGSDLYVTDDAGATWQAVGASDGTNVGFLGAQGWYDNCLIAHPFDEDIAYVGGVHIFKVSVTDDVLPSTGTVASTEENGTDAFLDFINFSAPFNGGSLDISADADQRTFVSVEIRFGAGKTQKAHRFLVPEGQGSGVADASYTYADYVDVPFEVWDIDNNRQLMVAFRDQGRDGGFDLIESNTAGDAIAQSREYLYISEVDYDAETPSGTIAVDAGHVAADLYFLWGVLAADASSDASTWPESEFVINWTAEGPDLRSGAITNIADAYNDFGGLNSDMHPDHHDYAVIIDDEENQTFRLLNSTDGGIYTSNSSTDPGTQEGDWVSRGIGYNTSQFYGADKAPGENWYFGGMQDNGTWQSPGSEDASATSLYNFRIGGDGYETIWHNGDINKMIGASQFNGFSRSLDGGATFQGAVNGITDSGPFVSKVANSLQSPDLIYTIGSTGVWRSEDFGGLWKSVPLDSDWVMHSNSQIEVSIANRNIVWVGGHMQDDSKINVSTDNGLSFNAVNNFTDVTLGRISGLSTHPTEDNTAYVAFSFPGTPKILKTTDLGQSWTDITGFGTSGGPSTNGFPDVATHCVLVMPHDTDWIWAGTEIGIVESLDGGTTWALLESNFPAVSVWQMQVRDDQVVIATHGRGIWSVTIPDLPPPGIIVPSVTSVAETPQQDLVVIAGLFSDFESVEVFVDGTVVQELTDPTTGNNTITIEDFSTLGDIEVKVVGKIGEDLYESSTVIFNFFETTQAVEYATDFESNANDFLENGILFNSTVDGFDDGAIHSVHPYIDNSNSTAQLTVAIEVASENATFKYDDIAIVEPGDAGVAFGAVEFWDYVIVEATKDGVNWVPLEDGYDSNYDATWTDRFSTSTSPTSADFVSHEINLLDVFEAGDVIFLRFRLFSDANATGWGWAIDNIAIQKEEEEEVTGFKDLVLDNQLAIRAYPNPVAEQTTLEFYMPQSGNAQLKMVDLNGRTIFENKLDNLNQGLNSTQWSRVGLEQGIYILELKSNSGVTTTRVQLN